MNSTIHIVESSKLGTRVKNRAISSDKKKVGQRFVVVPKSINAMLILKVVTGAVGSL